MFLTCCSPMSSKGRATLSRTWSRTTRLTQIPPGSARASSRAATLTPSPKMSPSSLMMSPRLIPTRNSMRRSGATPELRPANLALDLDGAAHRIDDAGELGQQAVTRGLDDASVVLGNLGIDEFAAMCLQPGKGALLVGTHEPAVAGDIDGQDGRQPPLHPLAGQACHLLSTCAKILVAAQ